MCVRRRDIRYVWFGLWGGILLGVGVSAITIGGMPVGFLGWPGLLVVNSVVGVPAGFTGPTFLCCVVGNVATYAGLGTLIGALWDERRASRRKPKLDLPECFICGHRGLSYLSHTCPKCGRPISFEQRMELASRIRLCSKCGYNLTLNTSGVCPECGEVI